MGSLAPNVTIGVDVGQRQDPTAVAVAEAVYPVITRENVHDGALLDEPTYAIRWLSRLPLDTPYPDVVERLMAVVSNLRARGIQNGEIRLDCTGVGAGVADPLRLRLRGTGYMLLSVFFTHSDRFIRHPMQRGERTATMGKAYLVSRLQALLQAGRVGLPNNDEARALADELMDYEIHVSESGSDTYGAFRAGTHDDLVTALGLATLPETGNGTRVLRDMERRLLLRELLDSDTLLR